MDDRQRRAEEQLAYRCLEQIAKGGKAAQKAVEKLYDCYALRFRKYLIYKFKCSLEASEDIVQDTFVKLVHLLDRDFAAPDHPRAWLYTILRNCAIDYIRKQHLQEVPVSELTASMDEDDDRDLSDKVPGHVATEDFWECVQRAFRAFREKHPEAGEALQLTVLESWTIRELASYLERNEGATREFLSQWRRRLRTFLEQFCHEYMETGDDRGR